MKKIIIVCIVFFFGLISFNYIEAENKKVEFLKQEQIKQKKIKVLNTKLNLLFDKINKKSKIEQKEFYSRLINKIKIYKNKNLNSNRLFLINIILEKFIEKNNSIKISKIDFKKSKTLILKFTNNKIVNKQIIEKNKNNIQNNISVFIFRKSVDLKQNTIKNISKEIKNYNPRILIFIDQEGGLINRYIDFETKNDIDKYFLLKNNKYLFLEKRLKFLNNDNLKLIRKIFPKKYGYFPSLEKIGKTYDLFKNEKNKKTFLEIIAFIRLQSLKETGINSYGIVLDLNRGNPVISGNKRSFSKHLWKYKKLVDAFIKAGKNTETILYAKHFPGHGDGKIDSHKGILNLGNNTKYLKENLDLFNYFLENSGQLQTGVMVGHILVNNNLKELFNNIISKSDFIITDDLAMQGYKKASGKKINNMFFSTDEIINNNKLIIVDTINISKIK